MTLKIGGGLTKDGRIIACISNRQITVAAEQLANLLGRMVMIDRKHANHTILQLGLGLLANGTDPLLGDQHALIFGIINAVFAAEVLVAMVVAIGFTICSVVSDAILTGRYGVASSG